uniref:Uncharacterized protein n=1 Tax=viral metagenome TaxID=1070528 RepID=A0A6M3M6W2_9ZZZZ
MSNPFDPLLGLPWRPGPPDAPGLWWVDLWGDDSRRALPPHPARYGIVVWKHEKATARWLEPVGRVAKPARGAWPECWRVAPVVITEPAEGPAEKEAECG